MIFSLLAHEERRWRCGDRINGGRGGGLCDHFKAIPIVFLQDGFYKELPVGRIRAAHNSLLLWSVPRHGTPKAPEGRDR